MSMCICLFINVHYAFIYSFIYLILCVGRVVGGSIPLTNIWRELLKGQIKIKEIILKKPQCLYHSPGTRETTRCQKKSKY